jgi:type I restriction enzyme M protein
MERRIFPAGQDSKGRSYEDYRWSSFKHFAPAEMFTLVGEHLFPFLRADLAQQLGNGDSTYAHHMKDARFTITTPMLLAKVVDLLDHVPMEDRDTKGDVYEYMLAKIASAGQNGQFRTPRHIIRLMVELTAPQPTDVICDPACGTAGFLVAAGEYLGERNANLLHDPKLREHFHHGMFHGFDFDNTMLRIGSMNMLLHGVESPDIRYRDSLAQDRAGEEENYTLVLANPPFAGSLDYENTAKDLLQIVKTKKTELLFLALFLRLLKPGGRAAVIVPDGVLFGSSKAHKELRRILVEDQKLDAVVKLPGGVFKPYAGVSTAILVFTKTNSGGTDFVWFYDVEVDGWSLDDKRTPLLPEDKLGPVPKTPLTASDLVELEQLLSQSGACGPDEIRRAVNETKGLGLFVRSLVGMDRSAAKEALAGFLNGKTFTANQLEFVNLIVDHLTEHGVMEPARLYESPFTDIAPYGPDGLFPAGDIDELLQVLDGVRATASEAA